LRAIDTLRGARLHRAAYLSFAVGTAVGVVTRIFSVVRHGLDHLAIGSLSCKRTRVKEPGAPLWGVPVWGKGKEE